MVPEQLNTTVPKKCCQSFIEYGVYCDLIDRLGPHSVRKNYIHNNVYASCVCTIAEKTQYDRRFKMGVYKLQLNFDFLQTYGVRSNFHFRPSMKMVYGIRYTNR